MFKVCPLEIRSGLCESHNNNSCLWVPDRVIADPSLQIGRFGKNGPSLYLASQWHTLVSTA